MGAWSACGAFRTGVMGDVRQLERIFFCLHPKIPYSAFGVWADGRFDSTGEAACARPDRGTVDRWHGGRIDSIAVQIENK